MTNLSKYREIILRGEETNATYYFGEDVDIFEYDDEGNIIDIGHDGSRVQGLTMQCPAL